MTRLTTMTRHRLHEAFLVRMARACPDDFVLHSGMVMRHWFPELDRPATDVDVISALSGESLREKLASILATEVDDGVVFDRARFRIDPLCVGTPHQGVRLFAAARVGGWPGELIVDVYVGVEVWPPAERESLLLRGVSVALWVCRPPMLLGRKLQVVCEYGPRRWRPKDLADAWLLLQRPMERSVVVEALARAWWGYETITPPLAECLADEAWWGSAHAMSRWRREVYRWAGVPQDVRSAIGDVRERVSG